MAEPLHKRRMSRHERKVSKNVPAAAKFEDFYPDGWRIKIVTSDSGRHFGAISSREGDMITYDFNYAVDETRAGSWADSCCGKMILDAKNGEIMEYYETNDGYISPEDVRAYVAPKGMTFLSKSWGYDDECEIWFKVE